MRSVCLGLELNADAANNQCRGFLGLLLVSGFGCVFNCLTESDLLQPVTTLQDGLAGEIAAGLFESS